MKEIEPSYLVSLVRADNDCTLREAIRAVKDFIGHLRASAQPPADLRDQFAAQALQGMLAHATRYRPREHASRNWHEAISEEAYELAGAMLEARKPRTAPVIDYELAVRAGYGVFQRQTHVGVAWDITWPGKTGMDNSMYKTEAAARAAVVERFRAELGRAHALHALIA